MVRVAPFFDSRCSQKRTLRREGVNTEVAENGMYLSARFISKLEKVATAMDCNLKAARRQASRSGVVLGQFCAAHAPRNFLKAGIVVIFVQLA